MVESKFAVIGNRRRFSTRAKLGGLLLRMEEKEIYRIDNIEKLRKNIGVSFDSMKKNLGFLIRKEGNKSSLVLEDRYKRSMDLAKDAYSEFESLSKEERKVCQLVFINLLSDVD